MSIALTSREVLKGAKQLLVQDGWTPSGNRGYHEYDWDRPSRHKLEPGKPWFITQALSCVAGSESSAAKIGAVQMLNEAVDNYIVRWELMDGRTFEDVIDAFDRALGCLVC